MGLKILHISTYDTSGGAARAMYRLHRGLLNSGQQSLVYVQRKYSNENEIVTAGNCQKFVGKLKSRIDQLPLKLLYPNRNSIFSPAFVPDVLARIVKQLQPDIIHLHWIADGFIRIESLKKINKPIVWTLHDMWAFTGGCHYSDGCMNYHQSCGNCAVIGSGESFDLSRRVWNRKNRAWKDLNLTLVSPSKWLAECAKNSCLMNDKRVEMIHNGINTNIFKPCNKKKVRELLNLPKDKKLILFGAAGGNRDPRKGFKHLYDALQILVRNGWKDQIGIIVFGSSESESVSNLGVKAYFYDNINDENLLASIYAAADVFVAPSLQDNLPNTILESMSSSTPCVAFSIGGMPDMIEHLHNGYLAKPLDFADLAKGILWVLRDENRYLDLCKYARKKVEESFELRHIAEKYLKIYSQLT